MCAELIDLSSRVNFLPMVFDNLWGALLITDTMGFNGMSGMCILGWP